VIISDEIYNKLDIITHNEYSFTLSMDIIDKAGLFSVVNNLTFNDKIDEKLQNSEEYIKKINKNQDFKEQLV
jgi:hypothetical protein